MGQKDNGQLKEKFQDLNEKQQLDHFYASIFSESNFSNRGRKEIETVMQLVMIFGHGNASVKWGFTQTVICWWKILSNNL